MILDEGFARKQVVNCGFWNVLEMCIDWGKKRFTIIVSCLWVSLQMGIRWALDGHDMAQIVFQSNSLELAT